MKWLTKLLLITFIFVAKASAQIEEVAYKYKITGQNDCAIEFGKIQISKTVKNRFLFRIEVNNNSGYGGKAEGYAKFTSTNVAVYKSADCGSITFVFKPNGILQIIEKNCKSHHGANICFNGNYIRY